MLSRSRRVTISVMACKVPQLLLSFCLFLAVASASVIRSDDHEQERMALLQQSSAAVENGERGLNIHSNVSTGKPIMNGVLGPMKVGSNLALTCTAQGSKPQRLQWYENGRRLYAERLHTKSHSEGHLTYESSVVLNVGFVDVFDDGRQFSCYNSDSSGSVSSSTVTITVKDVDIVVNGNTVSDGHEMVVAAGEELQLVCVSYGYSPRNVAWYEGSTKILSTAAKSRYASSSSVTAVTNPSPATSRRSFSCILEETTVIKTVHLIVEGQDFDEGGKVGLGGDNMSACISRTVLTVRRAGILFPISLLILATSIYVAILLIKRYFDIRRQRRHTRVSRRERRASAESQTDVQKQVLVQHEEKPHIQSIGLPHSEV